MILRTRVEPALLTILRFLDVRMKLSSDDKEQYVNLEKGFIGEQKFDLLLEGLSNDWLIVNDLLVEYKNNLFQIDSLMMAQETTFLIDVKNYEGDFYIEGDHWYTKSQKECKNPLHQLNRSEILLRKLLHSLGFNPTIQSFLIFINPEFFLYNATKDLPIIFPSQINRFMNSLKMKSFKTKDRHIKLAENLRDLHVVENPYKFVPSYSFEDLKKGLVCGKCNSFITNILEEIVVCKCGCIESIDSVIMRCVEEIRLLFPDKKITTSLVHEWCGGSMSKIFIRRILNKNYPHVICGQSSYYDVK